MYTSLVPLQSEEPVQLTYRLRKSIGYIGRRYYQCHAMVTIPILYSINITPKFSLHNLRYTQTTVPLNIPVKSKYQDPNIYTLTYTVQQYHQQDTTYVMYQNLLYENNRV